MLGFVLVFVHSLQPLAVAAADAGGDFVICTMLGAEPLPDGTPIHHDGCDACVLGACGLGAIAKAVVASAQAWAPVVAVAFIPRPAADSHGIVAAPPQGPPGIRAPPAFA